MQPTQLHSTADCPNPKGQFMNVLSREQQLSILHLIVEGNSLRSITRLTGIHRTSIMNLMVRVGRQCQTLLERWMRHLTLHHLQCDEIWTFVQKKQGKVPVMADDSRIGDMYTFFGIDEETKLVPCFVLGKRNKESTDLFAEKLAGCLNLPELFSPGVKPQISTDGWNAYPESIDSAFAGRCSHGVLIKDYRNAEQPGRYGPPELIGTARQVISGPISKWSICTSHVERHNLTVRTFLKRFTRLSLGFSKKMENLEAAIALYVVHYNFCRVHGSLKMTPAMKARVAGHAWDMEELLSEAESEQFDSR